MDEFSGGVVLEEDLVPVVGAVVPSGELVDPLVEVGWRDKVRPCALDLPLTPLHLTHLARQRFNLQLQQMVLHPKPTSLLDIQH